MSRTDVAEDRPHGARADHVHVAAHHVQELRDLVELVAAEKAADRRVERVAGGHEARADALLGVDEQRPELVDRERLETAPDPRPAIEHGTAARELDGERDHERDRRQRDEADRRHGDLPEPGEPALGERRDREGGRSGVLHILLLQRFESRHGVVSVGMGVGWDEEADGAGLAPRSTSSYQTTKKSRAQTARLWSASRRTCARTRRPTASGSKSPWRRRRAGESSSCT
jgi:hypothetical protein